MKRAYLWIIGCFSVSVFLICGLFLISQKANHRENGFIRLFRPHALGYTGNKLYIKYNTYYIAGLSTEHLYLGNTTAVRHLLVTNYALTDSQHLTLPLPSDIRLIGDGAKVVIDSPHVYLLEGNSAAVLQGDLSNQRFERKYPGRRFENGIPISKASIAAKVYDKNLKQRVLSKIVFDSTQVKPSKLILKKQIDGIFCTDGMLLYDPRTALLAYVYYYRNQYLALDTSLNIVYEGRTIDTTGTAKLQVAKVGANETVMSTPRVLVNKRCSLSNNRLYVYSGLRANNEELVSFNKHSVIDVYSLKSGEYEFSFYLPDWQGKKIKDFKVYNNYLIALYEDHLLIYSINL